jgi:hypothetical protein
VGATTVLAHAARRRLEKQSVPRSKTTPLCRVPISETIGQRQAALM